MPRFKARFPPQFQRHKHRSGKWSAYSSRSGTDDDYDLEKSQDGRRDHGDEYDSSTSSPTNSDSHAPMLAKPRVTTRTASAYQENRIARRRCNRYFTLVLLAILLIFILFLTGMSHMSHEQVEGARRKDRPLLFESFPCLKRYYGGIKTLVSRSESKAEYPDTEMILEMLEGLQNASTAASAEGALQRRDEEDPDGTNRRVLLPENPVPQSRAFNPFNDRREQDAVVGCFLDAESKFPVPQLHAYDGVMQGFPDQIIGSYDMLGLDGNVCFDRYGRFGPYGYGYSTRLGGIGTRIEGDMEGSEHTWNKSGKFDFRGIQWADVQARCMDVNKHRFEKQQVRPGKTSTGFTSHKQHGEHESASKIGKTVEDTHPPPPRHAVIIRTWADYTFDAEDLIHLRSLISELSLTSGTQYVVHFLVHVKDTDLPIWSDEEVYQKVLNESLPEEFRGMGTLWSERQMALIYAGLDETDYQGLGVFGVYRSTFFPVQHFAHLHPEFDFFWHWELDIRYTGHYLHLFTQAGQWAKQQPRKGLWERNGRFYIPSEHGSWEDFRQMVRVQMEHGTNSKGNLYSTFNDPDHSDHRTTTKQHLQKPVWGPLPPEHDQLDHENDPIPPTSYEKDKYEWGVGEEADLITFNPLFDPDQTGWLLAEDVTGYNNQQGLPPRRTAIITATRLSRQLLETMHRESALKKHTMFSEMWPGSCALHHGLKAVYVPHPTYIDRAWPTDYLAATFNGGLNGASGGARSSPFNEWNQNNFLGTTWYYNAGFAPNLFKRWMGQQVDEIGGPDWETKEPGEGRMCLPAMLLHPVKQVDLVYEDLGGDTEVEKDLLRDEFAPKDEDAPANEEPTMQELIEVEAARLSTTSQDPPQRPKPPLQPDAGE